MSIGRRFPPMAVIFLAGLLAAVPGARSQSGPPGRDVQELLTVADEDRRLDLLERVLLAEPPVAELVAAVSRGPRHAEHPGGGWSEWTIGGQDGRDHAWFLQVPVSYSADRTFPLLVLLHDSASQPEAPGLPALRRSPWAAWAQQNGCILAVPTARARFEWWTDVGARNVLRILTEVKREYNVDESRIYAVGVGEGAGGCYLLAHQYATLFAAFVAIGGHPFLAGWGGEPIYLRNFASRPLYVVTSDADLLFRPDRMTPVLEAALSLGAPWTHRHLEFAASWPNLDPAEMNRIGQWLAPLRRDPAPERLSFEGAVRGERRSDWLRVLGVYPMIDVQRFPDVNPMIASPWPQFGFNYDRENREPGLKITSVLEGYPAAAAGLQVGDVVRGLNGEEIRDIRDLRRGVAKCSFEGPFRLTVVRGDGEVTLEGRFAPAVDKPALWRSGYRGVLRAEKEGNRVSLDVSGVSRIELLIDPENFDIDEPVVVLANGKEVHSGRVVPDPIFLLEQALRDRDRQRVVVGRILVKIPPDPAARFPTAPAPRPPTGAPVSIAAEVERIVKTMHPELATEHLLLLLDRVLEAPNVSAEAKAPLYVALSQDPICSYLPHPIWGTAERILARDPETSALWPLLQAVRTVEVLRTEKFEEGVRGLREWARARLGEDPPPRVRQGLELLLAWVALDEGNPGMARRDCGRLAEATKADRLLHAGVLELLRQCGFRAPGSTVDDFSVPDAFSPEPVRGADFAGQALLVVFGGGGESWTPLLRLARRIRGALSGPDLAGLIVPLGAEGPRFETDAMALSVRREGWRIAKAGPESDAVGRAFGVPTGSALFLVSPTGRVLKSTGWARRGADRVALQMIREEIGTPVPEMLSRAERNGWPGFRATWHRLANGPRPLEEAVALAGSTGSRARLAVALALASRGAPPDDEWLPGPEGDLHHRLARAWCLAVTGADPSPWEEFVQTTRSPDSGETLELVDALFDLGLNGVPVRESLEVLLRRSKDWRIVSMALRGLSYQDTDADPRYVTRCRKHDRWQVRLAAAGALEGYRHQDSVDVLVDLLGDTCERVRVSAAASLSSLTGRDFGTSQKAWADWRRGEGRSISLPPRTWSAESTKHLRGHEYAKDVYFGLKIASRRVVFVLDKSDSMYYGLFDRVVAEVRTFLLSAGPTTSFELIEFQEVPRVLSRRLQPANDANIQKAVRFLNESKPYGPTNIMDSLELALATPEVDTVVLLSDGMPNRGRESDPVKIVEAVRRANRYERIAIHAVWMCEGRQFAHDEADRVAEPLDAAEIERREEVRRTAHLQPIGQFLIRLAEENDGAFGVAFADVVAPDPNSKFRDGTDK